MKKRLFFVLVLILLVLFSCSEISLNSETPSVLSLNHPLIADHNYGNLGLLLSIPQAAILRAKQNLHIAYGHTSHGSQVTSGMSGLVSFMNAKGYENNLYSWNNGGIDNALDLHDYAMAGDCGYYPQWVNNTRAYLENPSNSDVNVIIWSWCGQVSSSSENSIISNYLAPMTQLEIDYPQITFVYMTGHLDGGGLNGNLHLRNEQIREYCRTNNKVLYDFADIEQYDSSGNYFGDKIPNDNCDYDSNNDGIRDSNWALNWQAAHDEDNDWFNSSAAHSQPLNANQKAYAAWWLWARIAGWNGNI